MPESFKNQIEELKTKFKLLKEQLIYQRSSWIKDYLKDNSFIKE